MRPSVLSFAQAGEDRIVVFLFDTMGIKKVTYIDIGANHPVFFNNTYLLYRKGSIGVLIEPDPVFREVLQKRRPKDKVIEAAVTDKVTAKANFYIFDEPSVNTLSKEEVKLIEQESKYKLKEVKEIDLLTIENIISNHLNNVTPHLVSLDVEGVDFAVLNNFNFSKYPIPVWIVETCKFSVTHIKPKLTNILTLMEGKGYFIYADTYVNTIFVNKEWFNNYIKSAL